MGILQHPTREQGAATTGDSGVLFTTVTPDSLEWALTDLSEDRLVYLARLSVFQAFFPG